mmetsp:Transcript_32495/g.81842  ORF Transcript_32495/g.81842 Transcript_32495/m.81842 type:complete len:243 (-) Transcript_32495:480-1208(-)
MRTCMRPCLKAVSAACRLLWSMSPCSAPHFTPAAWSSASVSTAACLRLTNTSTSPSSTNEAIFAVSQLARGTSPLSTTSTACVTSALAPPGRPTVMVSASSPSTSVTRRLTRSGMVALNSSACRSGRTASQMDRTCASNPMSSIRSASSSTRYVTRRRLAPPFMRHRSIRRPGVATTTSAPARKSLNCSCLLAPPNTPAHRMLYGLANFRASAKICAASSRTGASASTMGPSPFPSSGWSTA